MCQSLDIDMCQSDLVSMIVEKVTGALAGMPQKESCASSDGIFDTVDEAVAAAIVAQKQLMKLTLAQRGKIIDAIRDTMRVHTNRLAAMELEETGMGRYEHKIAKINLTINKTPGLEDVEPEVLSGDDGLTLIERRAFGVAGCIMPSTAPAGTTIHNTICMIAAGNAAVLSPHPGGKNTTLETMRLINEAIQANGGPKNLVVCTREATLQSATQIMQHPQIDFLLATGGPGVVREILSSGKKGIGAGPGNPPVLVDETADIPKAAKDIVDGCAFENCLQCIGEKECFVVDSVADLLIGQMQANGAYLIKDRATIDRMTEMVTENGVPSRKYIGKNADVILRDLGIHVGPEIMIIIYEVPADHITVIDEYLMPLLPIVRVRNVDEGIELAVKVEGRRRHSAMMHSRDVRNITKYAKAIETTILVKNGPSYAGVGLGGEGFISLSIAGPTGEGLTSPRSFTRPQRCVMVEDLSLRSAIK